MLESDHGIRKPHRHHVGDEATALLRKAAEADDEFGSDPPLFGAGARLALNGALLEASQSDEAGKQIAETLPLNAPSTWTHQGLAQSGDLRGARAWKTAEGSRLPWL